MNQYFRLTGNYQKIAKVLIKRRITFYYTMPIEGIEFILNDFDPTLEELVKEIGVKNVSVHCNFRTEAYSLYALYHK